MLKTETSERPGERLVERYMPDATDAERDLARAHVREFAAVILRIAYRIATEEHTAAIRANRPRDVK